MWVVPFAIVLGYNSGFCTVLECTNALAIFFITASGPSPSARPTSGTDKKVSGGVPAGGVGPIGDVDYTDIPNTQIRRVRAHCMLDLH